MGSSSSLRASVVAGIAVVLIGAVVVGAWRIARQGAVEHTASEVEAPASSSDATGLVRPDAALLVGAAEVARLAADAREVEPATGTIVGIVVSAASGTVISGAAVDAVEPSTLELVELERHLPGFLMRGLDCCIEARHRGGWPHVEGLGAAELLRTGRLRVTGLASAADRTLASTRTDAAGRFELAVPSPATLCVTADGFATRSIAAASRLDPIRVELHPARRFSGRVRLADGSAPPSPLLLAFYGEVPGAGDPESWNGVHVSRARCAPDGRFELEAGATRVALDVVEPGWRLEPPWSQAVVTPDVTADIVVAPEPCVRFVASESGAPLVSVFLARRHTKVGGQVGLAGEFLTREGRLGLDFGRIPLAVQEQIYGALEYTVWAPQRAVAQFSTQDVLAAGELVVSLAPGELARLEGLVHRGGAPLVDADVRLLASPAWIEGSGDERTIGATRTDERGRFTLQGPPGGAQIVVRTGAATVRSFVELPSAVPLHIDFRNLATLTVRVERADGTPASQHVVGREGADGRRTEGITDEQGLACFTDLPAGPYRVWAPATVVLGIMGTSDPAADVTAEVTLVPGEVLEVRLVLPPRAPSDDER